jgi:ABC-type phosphate/phosphonate transport system ATPase subunit
LAGGPSAEQSAQKRNAVNQLLGVSDQNLKRAADMQLSAAQQDTVLQTRQFMQQSKAAMADGDFERARTFAWKAQLLSEDLVKPEK